MSNQQANSCDTVRSQLIGAWRLISWSEDAPSGDVAYPLGENAKGQIIYSADGHVAAHLMRANSPVFESSDWRKSSPAERAEAWISYFGYFGTFSIDEANEAVIHHVEGSWFPNLNGTDQVRYFRFEGKRLVLNADTSWGRVQIVWEKHA